MTEAERRLAHLAEVLGWAGPLHVVDVGANPIGAPVSYSALRAAGLVRITGFEPQPEALDRLTAAKTAAETYLPHAIGDGARATLHICRNEGYTSLFPPDQAGAAFFGRSHAVRVVETVDVETRRLDDLDAVAPIDFLKIDIQGGELGAIAGGREKLSQAVAIQTEVRFFPIYENEPTFGDLEAELRDQGFRLHSFMALKKTTPQSRFRRPMRIPFYTQLVDGDAVFLRDIRGIERWDDRAVAKLAVLADSVMDAPDLTLFALDLLAGRQKITAAQVDAYAALLPPRMFKG